MTPLSRTSVTLAHALAMPLDEFEQSLLNHLDDGVAIRRPDGASVHLTRDGSDYVLLVTVEDQEFRSTHPTLSTALAEASLSCRLIGGGTASSGGTWAALARRLAHLAKRARRREETALPIDDSAA